jgi:hypothetical protein
MIAFGTHVAVCRQAEDVVTTEPTKADMPTVQKSTETEVMVLSKVMFLQL